MLTWSGTERRGGEGQAHLLNGASFSYGLVGRTSASSTDEAIDMAMTALSRTIMVLEEFRKIDKELPMQTALTLLHIARKPGIGQLELAKLTGMGRSSLSRQCAYLSEDLGKGYIKMREDPLDRRNRVAHLTHSGEQLVASLRHIVDPTEAE